MRLLPLLAIGVLVPGTLGGDVQALLDVVKDLNLGGLLNLALNLDAFGDSMCGEDEGGDEDLLGLGLHLDVDELVELGVGLSLGGGGGGGGGSGESGGYYDPPTIGGWTINDAYCDQPLFTAFLPKTDTNCLIDNICYTFFPAPDNPSTFTLYQATVFMDGSTSIKTTLATDLDYEGRLSRIADPYCTVTQYTLGYAGCDTYVNYWCLQTGECTEFDSVYVVGLSPLCVPLGLSCVDSVQDIVRDAGLPQQDFVILPMKLPNRCVTEQLCVNNIEGNFYRALGLPLPAPPPVFVELV